MRESISAEERLVATLRFLSTGRSYEDLKYSCAVSAQALGKIIPETCWAIYQVLSGEYLKVRSYMYNVYVYRKICKIFYDFMQSVKQPGVYFFKKILAETEKV